MHWTGKRRRLEGLCCHALRSQFESKACYDNAPPPIRVNIVSTSVCSHRRMKSEWMSGKV